MRTSGKKQVSKGQTDLALWISGIRCRHWATHWGGDWGGYGANKHIKDSVCNGVTGCCVIAQITTVSE